MNRLLKLSVATLTGLALLGGCARPTISLAEFHARQGRVPMSESLRVTFHPCAADHSPIADPRTRGTPEMRGQTC